MRDRKAQLFFVIAIVTFLICQIIIYSFSIFSTVFTILSVSAAILLGLFFVSNPKEGLIYLKHLIKTPIYIIEAIIGILIVTTTFFILIIEVIFPFLLGFAVVNFFNYTSFFWAVILILYIAGIIAFRKELVKVIDSTIEAGKDILKNSLDIFRPFHDDINDYLEKVYKWIKNED